MSDAFADPRESEAAQETLREWEQTRADVVALAMVASLARRIEPELLRALRLSLRHWFTGVRWPTVGTEAALWFSPFVESRGPDSITLLPEFTARLRERLQATEELLEAARQVVLKCHAAAPPVIQWEEALIYLSLSARGTDADRVAQLERLVWRAVKGLASGRRRGLCECIVEMAPRLPGTAKSAPPFALLLAAARALLARETAPDAPLGLGAIDFSQFPTKAIEVARVGQVFRMGDLAGNGRFRIRVPDIKPITIQALPFAPSGEVLMFTIPTRGFAEIPVESGMTRIRAIDGKIYLLDPTAAQRAERISFDYDVFLSHDSGDKPKARKLAERLKTEGLRVWWDEWVLIPGANISEEIEIGLERSRTLTLCMSSRANDANWAALRVQTLRFRNPADADRQFIPLLLEDGPIPDEIRRFAFIDLRGNGDEQFARLLGACRPPSPTSALTENKGRLDPVKVLHGHTGAAWRVALSPNGSLACSASDDHTLRVWDLHTWECIQVLHGHNGKIFDVALTPSGQAITASADQTVCIWELAEERARSIEQSPAEAPVKKIFLTRASDAWEPQAAQIKTALLSHGYEVLHADKEARNADAERIIAQADLVVSIEESFRGDYEAATDVRDQTEIARRLGKPHWRWLPSDSPDKHLGDKPEVIVSVLKDFTAQILRWLNDSSNSPVSSRPTTSGQLLRTLIGHDAAVSSVATTPDGQHVISGSFDATIRVWECDSGRLLRVLRGHAASVLIVRVTASGRYIVSGSGDGTVRIWDVSTGQCRNVLSGHDAPVDALAITPDGQRVMSGGRDATIRAWDLLSGQCIWVLESHTGPVVDIAISPNNERAISSSLDGTLRVWDLRNGGCTSILKPDSACLLGLAVMHDARQIIAGTSEHTVWLWELPEFATSNAPRFVSAKVVLVGDTGVGKSGLAMRLTSEAFEPTASTQGRRISRIPQRELSPPNVERDIWLWDLAGQQDYQLIHQLSFEHTTLALLVIDGSREDSLAGAEHWIQALNDSRGHAPAKLLVVARSDRGGPRASRQRLARFCEEHGFSGFVITSAKTGEGCEELREAIAKNIRWENIAQTSAPQLFKTIRDAVQLQSEKIALLRVTELRQRLQLDLGGAVIEFGALRSGLRHLEEQGLVHMLSFGDFILLQPDWINGYAAALVRAIREQPEEIGSIPERTVLERKAIFQRMQRLEDADEFILLVAIEEMLLRRSLCFRESTPEGPVLVFPAYFLRETPDPPERLPRIAIYSFVGPANEIFTTLLVRLSYTHEFGRGKFWRNAADFEAPAGQRAGLRMAHTTGGNVQIGVYFNPEVPASTKALFLKYIEEHLRKRANDVVRTRSYTCPQCATQLSGSVVRARIERGYRDMICPVCEARLPLIDQIEEAFASGVSERAAFELEAQVDRNLDSEILDLILTGHALAVASEAGQIFRAKPDSEVRVDGEIEFRDTNGKPSGRKVYLAFESRDWSRASERGDPEIVAIEKPQYAAQWLGTANPVMLVIRAADGQICWMNVTDHLRRQGVTTERIALEGEPFSALSLLRLRTKLLSPSEAFAQSA
jgi:small GTP-binding protein